MTSEERFPEPCRGQATSAKEFKLQWWRRSRNRAKYHELELLKNLARHGWTMGRRFTASGPFLGLVDCYAVKDTPDKYIIGLFQIKPRLRTLSAYFQRQTSSQFTNVGNSVRCQISFRPHSDR